MTTKAINELKQFQLLVPFTTKSQEDNTQYTENSDGTLTIEGVASTSNKDLQGDIILPSAIHSMKQQLLTTTKNLHGDHYYGLDGIYGAIKEVLDSDDNSLKIKADILKSKSPQIKDMLDVGVNLGLSIGGKIEEYNVLNDEGWEIKDLRLMEISLTGMPANWDTYGTIQESTTKSSVKAKCLAGACHVIRKNSGDIMSENNNIVDEGTESFSRDEAVDLFNELMASKQDELVREITSETVSQVSKEIPSLVKAEFDKLVDGSNDEDNNSDDDSMDDDKVKALTDLINQSVKSAVDDNIGNLFKDLERHREPTFKTEQVNDPVTNNGEGCTSRELAEKMFANQSTDRMINSLL